MNTVYVDTKYANERADSYICSNFQVHSRSFLADHWDELVSINGKKVKPSYRLKVGDEIIVQEEKVAKLLADKSYDKIIPQEFPLQIIYECDSYLVLNKPKGIPVHPGVGNSKNTLANYVAGYLMGKREYDPTIDRAGVVHRLDKPVSGLIVFAKNSQTQQYLQKQFEMHNVQKIYHAKIILRENTNKEVFQMLPKEKIEADSVIDEYIRVGDKIFENGWLKLEGYIGRSSVNRMKMMFKPYPFDKAKYALSYMKLLNEHEMLIVIKTGRMYQIRASLEYLGIYIDGDTLFKTVRGMGTPDTIALESVFLSFEDQLGKVAIYRLI